MAKKNKKKELGAWDEVKKFHKTGMGKAMIWGGAAGLALKAALGMVYIKQVNLLLKKNKNLKNTWQDNE